MWRPGPSQDDHHMPDQQSSVEKNHSSEFFEHSASEDNELQPQAPRSFCDNWMSLLDNDDALMSSLTLPGTHDSAAYTSSLPFVATQRMTILQQLQAGIRYLDLRCGLRDNIAEMVHGSTYLGLTLSDVLNPVYMWLETHPKEALIVQIKQDREPERSSLPFSKVIAKSIAERPNRWRTADTTPTLGELGGKIQLFRRYDSPDQTPCGIDVTVWVDNPSEPFTIKPGHDVQLTVQDHYDFPDSVNLPTLLAIKSENVTKLLDIAARDSELGRWYLNFTSASEFNILFQYSPRTVAVGGYWDFRWEDGLNTQLSTHLKDCDNKTRFGIIIMDFPELGAEDIIGSLIRTNLVHRDGLNDPILRFMLLMVLVYIFISPMIRIDFAKLLFFESTPLASH